MDFRHPCPILAEPFPVPARFSVDEARLEGILPVGTTPDVPGSGSHTQGTLTIPQALFPVRREQKEAGGAFPTSLCQRSHQVTGAEPGEGEFRADISLEGSRGWDLSPSIRGLIHHSPAGPRPWSLPAGPLPAPIIPLFQAGHLLPRSLNQIIILSLLTPWPALLNIIHPEVREAHLGQKSAAPESHWCFNIQGR